MSTITCSLVLRRSGARSRRRGTDIQKDGHTKDIRIEKHADRSRSRNRQKDRQTDRHTYVKRNRQIVLYSSFNSRIWYAYEMKKCKEVVLFSNVRERILQQMYREQEKMRTNNEGRLMGGG